VGAGAGAGNLVLPLSQYKPCGAKSPARSVAADQQRNLQADRIVEIPLPFQYLRSNVAFHF